jgi:thiamine-monophosphate kinase
MSNAGIGEREIIRLLTKRFDEPSQGLPLGFDDDVSAFPMSRRKWIILKTDALVGSTDIPPGMSLAEASRKAVVATVSDFAAKGVQPVGLLISLALHPPIQPRMVKEIATGLHAAAREYLCRILGGDTAESTDLIINCIGFGFTEPGKIMPRNGAKPGDVVVVTGSFGKTSAGLKILLSSRKTLSRRFPKLVESVKHPVARLETGLRLAKSGMVNSSIDSSDGLAWSLHEVARLSNVSMILEKIPIAREAEAYARRHRLDPAELALYGGEEYELVLTIQREDFARLRRRIPSLIEIGTVEAGRGQVRLRSHGEDREVEPRGWEHMVSTNRS